MKRDRRIYLLSPKDFSPETIAVTFAKTSRSPKPFDEIARELTNERASEFHEKWVVGYGHASVAEHAVLHLALENVSRLAIETIEGNRLASYTEKSTRYQQWDEEAFFIPEEFESNGLKAPFVETCQCLFTTYHSSIPRVEAYFKRAINKGKDESEKAIERRVRTAAVDVCRFLLPAAALANVGVTINARALEYAICKMLSAPLVELQQIGDQLRRVAGLETPTLIKYAACNPYLLSIREKAHDFASILEKPKGSNDFRRVSFNPNGQDEVLAAILFRFSARADYENTLAFVQKLDKEAKKNLVVELMNSRGRFDQPVREFEYAQMTFEVVMDQGAYFEFKRHRMMTQTVQQLSPDLGFVVPRAIKEAGCEQAYIAAMRKAGDLFKDLAAVSPDAASYIIPNGFNRRVLFTMNLREAFNFVRLRTAENAHFSIRRIAQQLVEAIREIYPLLGGYLDAPDEDWWDIERDHFSDLRVH